MLDLDLMVEANRNKPQPNPWQRVGQNLMPGSGQAYNRSRASRATTNPDDGLMLANMAAYMAPGAGDVLAVNDGRTAWDNAYQAFGEGNYLRAASQAATGSADYLSALPAIGAVGDIGRGVGELAALGMTAWHGSPHKFNKFSSKNIGTGEGAQAYGHGLYFAENPEVAGQYRKQLSSKFESTVDGHPAEGMGQDIWEAADYVGAGNGSLDDYIQRIARGRNAQIESAEISGNTPRADVLRELLREEIDVAESLRGKDIGWREGGHTYEVDIPDEHIDKMLDWDAPLSEQPDNIKAALSSIKTTEGWARLIDAQLGGPVMDQATGRDLYKYFGKDELATSEYLKSIGIPGIKYYDGMSRQAINGEILGITKGADGWTAKVRGKANDGFGSIAPSESITTSKPFSSEVEAKKWADKFLGSGTRNFVVFDDSIVKTLSRNGEKIGDTLK
jgi:hypothetical protein